MLRKLHLYSKILHYENVTCILQKKPRDYYHGAQLNIKITNLFYDNFFAGSCIACFYSYKV